MIAVHRHSSGFRHVPARAPKKTRLDEVKGGTACRRSAPLTEEPRFDPGRLSCDSSSWVKGREWSKEWRDRLGVTGGGGFLATIEENG